MKKLVLVASIASMFSGAAFAVVNLDPVTPPAVPGSGGVYANEIVITAATTLNKGAEADQTATVTLGATFAIDSVAYVRYELSSGTFVGAPSLGVVGGTAAVAQGGAGQAFVVFAVTPTGGTALATGATLTFETGTGISVTGKGNVTLTYTLYETLTNAANSTLPLKTAARTFLTFADALAITPSATLTRTADVGSTGGAYRTFVNGITQVSLLGFEVEHTTRALLSGAASTAATILANTNSVVISGDFAARKVTSPTVSGVTLSTSANCGVGVVQATSATNTTATFSGISANDITSGEWFVCYEVTGTTPIAASTYTGAIDLVGLAGFSPTDGVTGTGQVLRNGTVLKAAFAEASTVSGTASAISLTNTSGSAAPFTVRCLTSGAPVVGTPGSVPANSSGRFAIVSALGCPAAVRGIELTFAVPQGSVIGSVVRQNLTTGVASFDGMVGNQ